MEIINTRVHIGRIIFLILATFFACSVTIQFLLAGMAIFISPVYWMNHMTFVHMFGFNIPLFMLVFAWIGAMPRWAYWHLFGIFTLTFLMYFTANITTILTWFGALHPVIGVLLLLLSFTMIVKGWKLAFANKSNRKGEI